MDDLGVPLFFGNTHIVTTFENSRVDKWIDVNDWREKQLANFWALPVPTVVLGCVFECIIETGSEYASGVLVVPNLASIVMIASHVQQKHPKLLAYDPNSCFQTNTLNVLQIFIWNET